jgi:type IX secretion system PorP/SprF family membrane protein
MIKKALLIFVFSILGIFSFAQDLHFSQFYNSPLILNPALTGNSGCLVRLGGNYRSQWSSITTPYKTFSFFADVKLDPPFLGRKWIGLGGYFYKDIAGDGNLSTTDAAFTVSFNMPLSKKSTVIMSIGATIAYMAKKVNLQSFYFDNQWTGLAFDPSIPSNESFLTSKYSHADFSVGMLLSGENRKGFSYHIGGVFNHASMPKEYFISFNNLLPWQIVAHAGINVNLSRKFVMSPKAYFSLQAGAKEILFGTNFTKKFSANKILFGIWYRWSGDVIGTLGFDIAKFQFMFSYDANISKLTSATKSFGGFEVTLIKTFLCGKKSFFKRRKGGSVDCPSF